MELAFYMANIGKFLWYVNKIWSKDVQLDLI